MTDDREAEASLSFDGVSWGAKPQGRHAALFPGIARGVLPGDARSPTVKMCS